MKFNKKILKSKWLIPAFSLIGISILSLSVLTSCSQGATPDLYKYDMAVNAKDFYRINGSSISQKNAEGTYVSPVLYNPSDEKQQKDPLIQESSAKTHVAFAIGQYLQYAINNYISYITRMPSILAGPSITGFDTTKGSDAREFQIAFANGFGEGKNVYRLKITSIDFTIDYAKVWPSTPELQWKEAILANAIKEIKDPNPDLPADTDKKIPDLYKAVIGVSDIKASFGWWKTEKGSSIQEIPDITSSIVNNYYNNYWQNYDDGEIKPTFNKFQIALKQNLYFKVIQGYYIKSIKDETNKDVNKYFPSGQVFIDGTDPNQELVTSNLPFIFSAAPTTLENFDENLKITKKINADITAAIDYSYKNQDFEEYVKKNNAELKKVYDIIDITKITGSK